MKACRYIHKCYLLLMQLVTSQILDLPFPWFIRYAILAKLSNSSIDHDEKAAGSFNQLLKVEERYRFETG